MPVGITRASGPPPGEAKATSPDDAPGALNVEGPRRSRLGHNPGQTPSRTGTLEAAPRGGLAFSMGDLLSARYYIERAGPPRT